MTDSARKKGVFFFQEPTKFALKSCIFFWKTIVVYESFISDIRDSPELTAISKTLFENNVLKIVHTPEGLKSAMWDKVYHGLDEDLRYLLHDHPERFVLSPNKPDGFDEIIKKSTNKDEKDEELKKLIDQIVRLNILQEWYGPLFSHPLYNNPAVPEELKKGVLEKINKLVEMQIAHNKKLTSQGGHGFEWRNKMLMEQVNTSSAMLVEYNWIPYYQYKLGDRHFRDARSYLAGLDTIYPFLKKKTIDAYSIEDILEIRKNRRWNAAMEKMTDICDNARLQYSDAEYHKEISEGVQTEMLDYLDEEIVTYTDLLRGIGKEGLFTAIGIIPVIGNIISTAAGLSDPIIEYMTQTEKQRSLPFFINDLRKI